ncbi:MAG: glycosyltransferase family 4 protein [Acidiferrobacterales bacterium]
MTQVAVTHQTESNPLSVLMISTSYPADDNDWRGRFIANLVTALSKDPSIRLSTWMPPGNLPDSVKDVSTKSDQVWLGNLMAKGGIAHRFRTHPVGGTLTVLRLMFLLYRAYGHNSSTQVAHVNWLQNAIPLLSSRTPAVISVLGTDFALLRLPMLKALLRHVLRRRRCIIAPNATWMVPELEAVFGDVAKIRPVLFGVDSIWYGLRRDFSPSRTKRWLIVSRITDKKIGPLFEWGHGLFGQDSELHLFGPMQEQMGLPQWIQYHGPASSSLLANEWFPSAAGLITLSQHDEGRPQVMLEAMAAGLPIIASDISAHRDFVHHKKTGWLVSNYSGLAEGLVYLGNAENNHSIGSAARAWAQQNVGTWEDCAAHYKELYAEVING